VANRVVADNGLPATRGAVRRALRNMVKDVDAVDLWDGRNVRPGLK